MGNFGTEWLDVAGVVAQSASGGTFKPCRGLNFFLPPFRDEIFRLVCVIICENSLSKVMDYKPAS